MTQPAVAQMWSEDRVERQGESITVTRGYTVITTNDFEQPEEMSGIPAYGEAHPVYTTAKVDRKQATRVSPRFYNVIVTWQTPDRATNGGGSGPSGLNRTVFWQRNSETVSVDQDFWGNPITNSAMQPLDPPLQKTVYSLSLIVEQDEKAFDPDKAMEYLDTVNGDTFYGKGPGRFLCVDFGPVQPYPPDATTIRVRYEFALLNHSSEALQDAHQHRWMDKGTIAVQGDSSTGNEITDAVAIRDASGSLQNEPVRLNGYGGRFGSEYRLAPGDTLLEDAVTGVRRDRRDRAMYLVATKSPQKPWKPLGLE